MNHKSKLHRFFMYVASCCGSALLWLYCNILSTSSFVDDVMFFHNGPGPDFVQVGPCMENMCDPFVP